MKNNKYLIAIDLDGTLLTDDKKISRLNMQTITSLQKRGHKIVIATGRSNHASISYYHTLKLNTPMINFNGALTYHPLKEDWKLNHIPIPAHKAIEMITFCKKISVDNIIAETNHNVYIDQKDKEIVNLFLFHEQTTPHFTVHIEEIAKHLTTDPTSLLIQPKENQHQQIQQFLTENFPQQFEFRSWGSPWNIFDVTLKGIHKGYALQKLASYYQIPRDRVIAFGDETNDLEMLKFSGIGVAMENAAESLKKIADHITFSNEKDGVGKFLKNYFSIAEEEVY